MNSQPVKWNLNIFLIKEDFRTTQQIISLPEQRTEEKIRINGEELKLFIKKIDEPSPPIWTKFFEPHIPKEKFGKPSSPAAVLLIPTRERIFGVAFGSGRHLMNSSAFERSFGLKVVLNLIDEESLRSVDAKRHDGIFSRSRTQGSVESGFRDYRGLTLNGTSSGVSLERLMKTALRQ